MAAKYTAGIGANNISLNGVELSAAAGAGEEFAITIPNHGTPVISWQTAFSGGNPASITVLLEASLDGTNWFTVDTSTSVTGELRTVTGSYRFVRLNNSAVTVGTGINLLGSFTQSNIVTQPSSIDEILFANDMMNIPTTGTIEQVLKSVTIPANAFNTNFMGVEVWATFLAAANVNAKSCRIRMSGLAGTSVLSFVGDTSSGNNLQLYGYFPATISGTLLGTGLISRVFGGGTTVTATGAAGLNFAAPIDIVATGQTAVAAGDLSLTSMKVLLLRKKL